MEAAKVCSDPSQYIHIKLQDGPLKENPVNGCQIDDVIKWCIGTIAKFNTKIPCPFNGAAILHLKEAVSQLEDRKRDREARDVEGTMKD